MKVVYVAHALGSGPDRETNRANAAKWVAWVGLQYAPIATWITLSGEWDESWRKRGLAVDFALIERCDEVWLVGEHVSPGMKLEAAHASKIGKPVVDLTYLKSALPPERYPVFYNREREKP